MNSRLCQLLLIHIFFLLLAAESSAQQRRKIFDLNSGMFSLGTRNTVSLFSDDVGAGVGIGGQFRLQINDRINTEWFADYITSRNTNIVTRNDYHIGWSVMFYPGKNQGFEKLIKPYILAGHCFDMTVLMEHTDPANRAQRKSMATQAGLGTHINMTSRFDCSVSGQYMLHFGKEIHAEVESDNVEFVEHRHGAPHGHLLLTISFNYKFADLW